MHDDLTHEHYWAAGFLEGEGCVTADRANVRIAAGQNFREPLERLQAVVGGRIYKQGYREFYEWRLSKWTEVQAALEWLGPLLSSRRQEQIAAALRKREEYKTSDKRLADNARISARTRERYRTDPEFRAKEAERKRRWMKAHPEYRAELTRKQRERREAARG